MFQMGNKSNKKLFLVPTKNNRTNVIACLAPFTAGTELRKREILSAGKSFLLLTR
jgi:hypothetical protein